MTENETYLSHLRAQLTDLKAAKTRYEETEDQINEMEQHYLMLKQERAENEAHLEESIKTHTKILEGAKTENNFMVKNLMDKQVLTENSFQLLNAKKQELAQTRADVAAAETKLDSLTRHCTQMEDKIAATKTKIAQTTAERIAQQTQLADVKENLRMLAEQVTGYKMNAIDREKECLVAEKKREGQASLLEEKRLELRQLQAQVEASRTEMESVQDQIENKNRQIRDMKQMGTQLTTESKELMSKLTAEADANRDLEG
jgi:chromosome segregation ATPase